MEASGADSPDAVVNELGERSLLGVFDTFTSDSRSRSTGELPKVPSQKWLGPVAAASRLGGIGFSAYRTDREGPGSERFITHVQEMDALREVSVPYVVVNMPHKRAKQVLARFQEHLTPSPITHLADLHEVAAATVRMQSIGTQAI